MTAALRAGRGAFPVHGLLELDVTEAVELLARREPAVSFTAFITAATARAAAIHPQVHAYRDALGRLVVHSHVDVAVLVEVEDERGNFPLAHALRDADIRTVEDLSAELRRVATDMGQSDSGKLLTSRLAVLARLPGVMFLLYRLLARSPKLRQRSGTVAVTSVGMFGDGGGAAIGQPTTMTVSVLVGGRSMRPRVIDGEIVPRLVLDLTISVDHAIVDGAPAARFSATLTDLIEHPDWIECR